jgi:hypothetical protein
METEHTQKAVGIIKENNFCVIQLKFTNGYVLSMNIGSGCYNDNRNLSVFPPVDKIETDSIECAVFDPQDKWVTRQFFTKAEEGGDTSVVGWATMKDVEQAMKQIMEIEPDDR